MTFKNQSFNEKYKEEIIFTKYLFWKAFTPVFFAIYVVPKEIFKSH